MARGDHAIWLVIFYSCISNPSAQTVRLYINALVAMVRLRITLGHLTALTRHLSGIWGSGFAAKRGRQGREGKERAREEGSLERKGGRERKGDSKGRGEKEEGIKEKKREKGLEFAPCKNTCGSPCFYVEHFSAHVKIVFWFCMVAHLHVRAGELRHLGAIKCICG